MPGYVMLFKWTQQGIASVKEAPERIKRAKAGVEKLGGSMVGVWVTMGQYDLVGIADLPNDEAAAIFALSIASLGNVTTQTMRALSEEEFAQVVAKLPS